MYIIVDIATRGKLTRDTFDNLPYAKAVARELGGGVMLAADWKGPK